MSTVPAISADASAASPPGRPRIVIVGAGFGGLTLAKADADVTVIDRRNYHLFQPLLYQVATAGLSPADIASPIRGILGRQANARVLMGRVTGIDKQRHLVKLGARDVAYDYLVLATGSRHAYFGHDEWEHVAPGLKKIDDATELRRRILLSFELAETEPDPAIRRRLLNFVVVGGGPTGVEMAGAIAELARKALASDFRSIDPQSARVVLVEAAARLLGAFPENLAEIARHALEKLGVEVRTGVAVSHCDANSVTVGNEIIACNTIMWAAGVAASPAGRWLGATIDGAGRAAVGADLSLPGHPEIFVIGDTARVVDASGNVAPGLAPAAKQMGSYVGAVLKARLGGGKAPKPFRYRHMGSMATIGRRAAIADFGWLRLSGGLAWLLWGGVHIFFLIGFRNRLAVLLDWFWAYLTFHRGARLITGPTD